MSCQEHILVQDMFCTVYSIQRLQLQSIQLTMMGKVQVIWNSLWCDCTVLDICHMHCTWSRSLQELKLKLNYIKGQGLKLPETSLSIVAFHLNFAEKLQLCVFSRLRLRCGQVIPAVKFSSHGKQHSKCIYAIHGKYAISVMNKINPICWKLTFH